jgi:hypothetical protein
MFGIAACYVARKLRIKKRCEMQRFLFETNEIIRCVLCEDVHPFVGMELRYPLHQNAV